ncbi:MAG: hypothetical protein QNM02_19320, partial [Acidimicrobiia bacterium]|nr:hypothetical protein [Acidimicrobiia bacterium]
GGGVGTLRFDFVWPNTEKPARPAPGGVDLPAIRWAHPDPDSVERARTALGFSDAVHQGAPTIGATIRGPGGAIIL